MSRVLLTANSECSRCSGTGTYLTEVYVPVELLTTGKNYIPKQRVICGCVKASTTDLDKIALLEK